VGDVLALVGGAFLCLMALVVRTVRADARAGGPTDPDWGSWLLLATGGVAMVAGCILFWLRVFSS
jgi:hypothetical protein